MSKGIASDCQRIEAIHAHHVNILGISGKVEADDDDKVGEDKHGAFEVVALYGVRKLF